MDNTPDLNQPEPRKHLAGSKGSDITLGIIVGILWWVIGWAIVASIHTSDGTPLFALIFIFLLQAVVVYTKWHFAGRFVMWQLLTVVLTPILAFGLVFGACLLGGAGHF